MSSASQQKFIPTDSSYHTIMDSYKIGHSHSELNKPLFIVADADDSITKQLPAIKKKDQFDSVFLIPINAYFEQDFNRKPISFKKRVNFLYHEKPNNIHLLSDNKNWFYKKPIKDLKDKICDVYNERQDDNWDGYEAEPLKFLPQSLQFAESLFFESRLLVESVSIIPENDGCLCFEWYKTDKKFISVSIKDEKLIYNYNIGGAKGCGETNSYEVIIEQIKRVA